jgi:hypothetical protein
MEQIIATLFAARDQAHSLHLKTRSFAAHVALGDLYDAIIELADVLSEMHQGKYGIMQLPTGSLGQLVATDDPVVFIRQFAVWAEAARAVFAPVDTFIQNEWDTLLKEIYRTKYKLENLS